jgi:hypothetical protein
VQVFAQGFIGLSDIFIHPSYLSSVSPLDYGETGGYLGITLGVILIGWGIFIYLYFRGRRKQKEQAESILRAKGPP